MKTVSILYHIIKNYMIRNKSIFIVFITSYILMGLLIVFIYGAFFPYVSERRSKDLLDCRYIVNFDGEMPIDYLSRFYQNMFIKDSRHFEVETRLSGQADSLSIHSVFSPEHDVILALKQSGRLYFTEDEIKKFRKSCNRNAGFRTVGRYNNRRCNWRSENNRCFRYYYPTFYLYPVQFIPK